MGQSEFALPVRWTPLRPHEEQQRYFHSLHRFNVVPAGRRSGKTEIAKRRLVRATMKGSPFGNGRYFAAAPTYGQAKRIYWTDLKSLVPPWMKKGKPSESELVLRLVNGSELHVFGMDKPERIEGSPWDGGILDEVANMKAHAWGENVRPALADRRGWCDLIGVPEGRNSYYDMAMAAIEDMQVDGPKSQWAHFHWKSADILDPAEIAAARRDLDELTFQQEYEGSFVSFEGRAYYVFDSRFHSSPLEYNPDLPLIFCFDFNVAPGVAVVCQEQMLPSDEFGTGVIGEVHIERNSTTPAVCRKLLQDWGGHRGRVLCYGDASGGAKGSAKVEGSDWDLIEKELRPSFAGRLHFKLKGANPAERARVNAVNSRLMSADGDIKLIVDGRKAPHVVKDLDGVILLKGGSGEIDKSFDPKLTHLSDALGYYIEYEFPIVKPDTIQRVRVGGT